MAKKPSVILCLFLLAYYAFTSGLVFTLSPNEAGDRIDAPYSVAMHTEEYAIMGVFNSDDLAMAEWIKDGDHRQLPVCGDYLGTALILGYDWTQGFLDYRELDLFDVDCYQIVTSWHTRHNKLVFGRSPGLREYAPLPRFTGGTVVFESGDTFVYEKRGLSNED